MKILVSSICILLTIASSAQTTQVCAGNVKRYENFASQFVKARNVDVWLPEGYSAKKKYSVLYMHDGQMLFDSAQTWNKQEWQADEAATKLLQAKKVKDFIIVGIWNTNLRHSEYFPQKPFESLPPSFQDSLVQFAKRNNGNGIFQDKVQSDNYLQFIVNELKPFIDKEYSTRKEVSNTFIAGSSMGGLISMYAICEYPNVFGGAACLSTHWPGIFQVENNPIPNAFIQYLSAHLPNPKNHKIYFDFGTATLDALYEPLQIKADSVMKVKGFSPEHWKTLKFEGEAHTERAWAKRLEIPFQFLLDKKSK